MVDLIKIKRTTQLILNKKYPSQPASQQTRASSSEVKAMRKSGVLFGVKR